MSPIRVQRRRTKGWRAPLCSCGCGKPARYVGRGTKWGNPWRVVGSHVIDANHDRAVRFAQCDDAARAAVYWYGEAIPNGWEGVPTLDDIRAELCGHDLMCWCPVSQPCHADVLLELANQGDPDD